MGTVMAVLMRSPFRRERGMVSRFRNNSLRRLQRVLQMKNLSLEGKNKMEVVKAFELHGSSAPYSSLYFSPRFSFFLGASIMST